MSARRRTPLRCPVCDAKLQHEQISQLGAVTADIPWELHSGQCPEHGWFQAEVISRPPREIFAVTRPGGATRKFMVGDRPCWQFPTRWASESTVRKVDPYDPQYWAVDWSKMPEGAVAFS